MRINQTVNQICLNTTPKLLNGSRLRMDHIQPQQIIMSFAPFKLLKLLNGKEKENLTLAALVVNGSRLKMMNRLFCNVLLPCGTSEISRYS